MLAVCLTIRRPVDFAVPQFMKHVVKLSGGLGNQLFQYSFAWALRKSFKDVSLQKRFRGDKYKRQYALDFLGVDNASLPFANEYKIIPRAILRKILHGDSGVRIVYEENPSQWKQLVSEQEANQSEGQTFYVNYYKGDWHSIELVENLEDFLTKLRSIQRELKPLESIVDSGNERIVGIHIRHLFDYADPRKSKKKIEMKAEFNRRDGFFKDLSQSEYYERAMAKAVDAYTKLGENRDNLRFLVFADDPKWCRDEWIPSLKDKSLRVEVFSDQNLWQDWEELIYLSTCDTIIASNSTFSWWSAMIQDKDVIVPDEWHRPLRDLSIIYKDDWTVVKS